MHSETWGPRESKQDPVSISGGLSAMMQLYLFPSAEGALRQCVEVCAHACMPECVRVRACMCVCVNLLGHVGGRQKGRY